MNENAFICNMHDKARSSEKLHLINNHHTQLKNQKMNNKKNLEMMFIVQITETPPYDVLLLDNILFYVPFENVSHWKLQIKKLN